jgi:hypothetical protein
VEETHVHHLVVVTAAGFSVVLLKRQAAEFVLCTGTFKLLALFAD